MDFFKANKKIFIWILIAICFVIMIVTSIYNYSPSFYNKFLSPVFSVPQEAIAKVVDWGSDKIQYNKENDQLVLELQNLEKENIELRNQNERLKLLQSENERLSNILGIKESYPDYDTVVSRVIAKDPSPWYDTFIIDVGTNDGIAPNMVVIADGGLVGKVTDCTPYSSTVISIVDSFSSVSGVVTRNDALGFVKGDSELLQNGMLKMEYFDLSSEVLEGDEIVTSQLSEVYPKDIPIGYVKEVYTDPNGLSKYAKIIPYVDFKNLKEVIVIKDYYYQNEPEEDLDNSTETQLEEGE